MTHKAALWLVAHDFSAAANAAADLAVDELLERKHGGRLSLVHVYSLTLPIAVEGVSLAREIDELEQKERADALTRLGDVANRLRVRADAHTPGAPIQIDLFVHGGEAAAEIVRQSGVLGAGRIVIGTRGRGGVVHAILGSVAEDVVRTSHVPVLVAHAPR